MRSGVIAAQWEGLGEGGAHQQQECRQLDSPRNCCFQVTLHKAVPNNQLLSSVRSRPALGSTLGPQRRFAQGAVAGNHPLPTSPTPWERRTDKDL